MRYVMMAVTVTGMFLASAAQAETAIIYDGNGNFAGTVQSAGRNNAFVYGSDGGLVGSTARAGNSTYFYGSDGSYAGQAVNNGRGSVDD